MAAPETILDSVETTISSWIGERGVWTDTRYFDALETRANIEDEWVALRDFTHYYREKETHEVRRATGSLQDAVIRVQFHFPENMPDTGEWTEATTTCPIVFESDLTETPVSFLWEQQSGTSGRLKDDEYFGQRKPLKSEIRLRDAICFAIRKHLTQTIPSLWPHVETEDVPSNILKLEYNANAHP